MMSVNVSTNDNDIDNNVGLSLSLFTSVRVSLLSSLSLSRSSLVVSRLSPRLSLSALSASNLTSYAKNTRVTHDTRTRLGAWGDIRSDM